MTKTPPKPIVQAKVTGTPYKQSNYQSVQPKTNVAGYQAKQPAKKTAGGFLSNIAKSAVSNVKDIGSAIINVANPNKEKNTAVNLGKLAVGTAQLAIPGKQGLEDRPKAVAEYYKQRYGSVEKAKQAAYDDPVGVALDASVVLGGAGAVVKGVGTAGKLSTVSKAGSTMTKASKALDPVSQASKVLPKISSKVSDVKATQADRAAVRSSKASPGAQLDFEEIANTELGQYMTKKGIYTMDDLKANKKVVQGMYDDSVKTGKKISGKEYAASIRQQAADIRKNDRSPSARAVADKLEAEAKRQEKLGNITDTVLTKTKNSSFGKAPNSVITDPVAVNFEKELGKAGIRTLDKVSPGSSRIGKELQVLKEVEDVLRQGGKKGLATQLFSPLKSFGVGAGVGAAIGTKVGGLPGGIIGAGIGGTATALIDSPTGQRVLAKTLKGAKTPEVVKKIPTEAVYNAGKAGSRLLPPIQSTMTQQPTAQLPPETVEPLSGNPYIANDTLPDQTSQMTVPTETTYITGRSPKEWNEASYAAMQDDNPDAAAYFDKQFAKEVAHQKTLGKGAKPLSGEQKKALNNAQTGLRSAESIEKRLFGDAGFNPNNPAFVDNSILYKTVNPIDQEGRRLKKEMVSLVDIIGFKRTGAAYTKEQRADYMYMLPSPLDDPQTAAEKLKNIYTELQEFVDLTSNTPELQPTYTPSETLPDAEYAY